MSAKVNVKPTHHDSVNCASDADDANEPVNWKPGHGLEGQAGRVQHDPQIHDDSDPVVQRPQDSHRPRLVTELQVLVDAGQSHLVKDGDEEVAKEQRSGRRRHQPRHREQPSMVSNLARNPWKTGTIVMRISSRFPVGQFSSSFWSK